MFRRRCEDVLTTSEMRRCAARRLPRVIFDAIDGGGGDEITLGQNRSAFQRIQLRPRALAEVTPRDLRTTVLGTPISMPLMLDPCGMSRMADDQGELAVARAA